MLMIAIWFDCALVRGTARYGMVAMLHRVPPACNTSLHVVLHAVRLPCHQQMGALPHAASALSRGSKGTYASISIVTVAVAETALARAAAIVQCKAESMVETGPDRTEDERAQHTVFASHKIIYIMALKWIGDFKSTLIVADVTLSAFYRITYSIVGEHDTP